MIIYSFFLHSLHPTDVAIALLHYLPVVLKPRAIFVMTTTTDPPEAKKLRLSAGPCPDPVISGNHCPERVVSDDIVPSCWWSTSNPIRPDRIAFDLMPRRRLIYSLHDYQHQNQHHQISF
jgi:hypothetical protein